MTVLKNKPSMKIMAFASLKNRLLVLIRFIIAFGLGYVCSYLLSENLTLLFANALGKAESVFLAAFISIFFYVIFVLICFCIQSLIRISILSTALTSVLFLSSRLLG